MQIQLPKNLIFAQNDVLLTDSQAVAKVFSKQHKHVLRDIDAIMDKVPEFACAHFWAYEEKKKIGACWRNVRSYRMTKDGFMLLVMGYNTDQAMQIKVAYIKEFNRMQSMLNNLNTSIMTKLLAALEAEKQSFATASLAGKILRKRQTEKPINQAKITSYIQQLQPLLNNFEVLGD
ncbi:Rha family transcriptional regulator [Snodgrassella alvi]|uniref:Rha family transcriptional regulator n=1 Tax=Snodgrassella alvi TaxID=1196083 RepID=UPI00155468B6|nr:Rha family transcriptional regulator [Snodgrassella alvi]